MKILFGVFDWGIGHATRVSPLIKELLGKGHEIHIISTGRALTLLKERFNDDCTYFDVPSLYNMYSYKKFFKIKFLFSLIPLIVTLIRARKKSKQIIRCGNYDKVISDCRYDVFDKKENSYLINHQVRFCAPLLGELILELWLTFQYWHYKYILVPDFEEPNLTGRLSHNIRYLNKSKLKYLGIISHIRKKDVTKDVDYFVSLSGPEETRKELLNMIIEQKDALDGNVVIAGGTPESKDVKHLENVKLYNFLSSKEQEDFMNRAKFIIIRAGYTTIMELVELGITKALLIPSPAQTEQVYLTKYYEDKHYFHHVAQKSLNLNADIKKSLGFDGYKAQWKTEDSIKKFMDVVGL